MNNTFQTTITERFNGSASLDRSGSVIRNVKLIGFESKNGRIYPPAVLKAAVHLYEGAKVNIDHPENDPTHPRKYGERIGVIRNVRFIEGRGNFGDFHFNPKHPMADQVAWDAENNPEALGFSHNALLRIGPKRDGKEVIESIVNIRSIDLVADPATTSSMFEAFTMKDTNRRSPMWQAFRSLVVSIFDDKSLDMKATMKKIKEAFAAYDRIVSDPDADAQAEDEAEKDRRLNEKLRKISTGIESMQTRETLSQLRTRAEFLHRTLEILERPARRMETRWGVGKQAKEARDAELRRAASRLKR